MAENKEFEDYLLKEYENIAEAHFKTIEAISSFFRYYLAILAVPITLVGIVAGLASKQELISVVSSLRVPVLLVSFAIAFVGLFSLVYLSNLRMDVVLYARVVNAIRKYYYDNARLDQGLKLQLRVLPQTPALPRYYESYYFLPIVFSFAVFNSMYFALGMAVQFAQVSPADIVVGPIPLEGWLSTLVFFGAHPVLYLWYARYRELYYLKTNSLGVDIDGVLNEHRPHFSALLKQNVGTILDPEKILTIPVDEDPSLNVPRDDVNKVFDDPRYWSEMPVKCDASDVIKRLRRSFGLRVLIFTHRPFPTFDRSDLRYDAWVEAARDMLVDHPLRPPRPLRVLGRPMTPLYNSWLRMRLSPRMKGLHVRPIEIITKCWLRSNNFDYDSLTIERGSEDVSDPRVRIRNRFYITRKKKLRFFVEDVAEKAFKLAFICDIVFLVVHPYNVDKRPADNVVPVHSWEEIYRRVREFS